MKKQEWVCEVCGLSGAVEHEEQADAVAVVYLIADHHDSLATRHVPAKAILPCRFDLRKVRVRNDALMDVYEWNRLVASIEKSRRSS
jgi:hypothetical protein